MTLTMNHCFLLDMVTSFKIGNMINHQERRYIILAVVLSQMLTTTFGWILMGPPYRPQFQNYIVANAIRVVKPPDLSHTPEFRPLPVDFRLPKTQSFFRAALIPSQDPVYQFGYKVHDPKEQNFQTKSEIRVGDAVKGSYSVLEPNGYVRMVKYLSDEHGFRTQVSHHHKDENGGAYSFSMTRSI